MAKGRSKCCTCVVFVLFVLGAGLLISGIVVAVLGSFTSLADDEIKKVSISTAAFIYGYKKSNYSLHGKYCLEMILFHTRFTD